MPLSSKVAAPLYAIILFVSAFDEEPEDEEETTALPKSGQVVPEKRKSCDPKVVEVGRKSEPAKPVGEKDDAPSQSEDKPAVQVKGSPAKR